MKFFVFLFLLAINTYHSKAQQLILTHPPFELEEYPILSYVKDTIVFDSEAAIWGVTLINTNVIKMSPVKKIRFSNDYGLERTAIFKLRSIAPNELNWHPVIRGYWQKVFDQKNWYALEISPIPSVIDAEAGVAILEIIEDILLKCPDLSTPQPLYYKLAENEDFRCCWIDFGKGEGAWEPLLSKVAPYRKKIVERRGLLQQQADIEKKLGVQGFRQISEWGSMQDDYTQRLKKDDEQLFVAIEKMKVMTEEVGPGISPEMKRLLRELFLLDIAILEAKKYQRPPLQKRRAELFKRITVYPKLKTLVLEYEKLTSNPKTIKKEERLRKRNLQHISRKFKPYEAIWRLHQKLQKQIDQLDKELKEF